MGKEDVAVGEWVDERAGGLRSEVQLGIQVLVMAK